MVTVTGAELAARRTAAAAVLADYQRAVQTADTTRAMWGARLADALAYLLAGLNAADAEPGGGR